MINRSYCRCRRRLTIFNQDEIKLMSLLTLLNCRPDHRRLVERFVLNFILETILNQIWQKFGVWSEELSKCFTKLVNSVTPCQLFSSYLQIFRLNAKNASATPSKSNQLGYVNTIWWESRSRNNTTQYAQLEQESWYHCVCRNYWYVNIVIYNFNVQIQERNFLCHLLHSIRFLLGICQEYVFQTQGYRCWIYVFKI